MMTTWKLRCEGVQTELEEQLAVFEGERMLRNPAFETAGTQSMILKMLH